VQAWGCDALACSAYKFFGPHVGILWARASILEELPAYKLRPVPESLPDRWLTGTQNHEGLAGVAAAVDYLAGLPKEGKGRGSTGDPSRNSALHDAMDAVQHYESHLAHYLLTALAERPRFKVWGITEANRLKSRVPTISITMPGKSAGEIAEHLAQKHIYVWNGNMYALGLSERLGLESQGGFLRIGLVHYNTLEEIDRLIDALDELLIAKQAHLGTMASTA
jgi:selenocysteine lyase/cysteine desulfurase